MPTRKIKVEKDGKTQEVIIAMTDEEAKDKSYMDYLELGATERTKDQLAKKPPREKSKLSKGDQAGTIKEYAEFRKRKRDNINPKYY